MKHEIHNYFVKIGRAGGSQTFNKYGSAHFAEIGRRGAISKLGKQKNKFPPTKARLSIKDLQSFYNEKNIKFSENNEINTDELSKNFEGRDFTREAVRRRDKYMCRLCFKQWKSPMRRFDIHHLNGLCGKKSKKYDKLENHKKLVSLCHKCHLNLENVREKLKKLSVHNKGLV